MSCMRRQWCICDSGWAEEKTKDERELGCAVAVPGTKGTEVNHFLPKKPARVRATCGRNERVREFGPNGVTWVANKAGTGARLGSEVKPNLVRDGPTRVRNEAGKDARLELLIRRPSELKSHHRASESMIRPPRDQTLVIRKFRKIMSQFYCESEVLNISGYIQNIFILTQQNMNTTWSSTARHEAGTESARMCGLLRNGGKSAPMHDWGRGSTVANGGGRGEGSVGAQGWQRPRMVPGHEWRARCELGSINLGGGTLRGAAARIQRAGVHGALVARRVGADPAPTSSGGSASLSKGAQVGKVRRRRKREKVDMAGSHGVRVCKVEIDASRQDICDMSRSACCDSHMLPSKRSKGSQGKVEETRKDSRKGGSHTRRGVLCSRKVKPSVRVSPERLFYSNRA
ncbi:hypothetical protein B0H19DRAFT_1080054 [Mycena capillaripes]|nr:hypothetical protein B0H19DRAFT_1080054 [Mycena capillaripes]